MTKKKTAKEALYTYIHIHIDIRIADVLNGFGKSPITHTDTPL